MGVAAADSLKRVTLAELVATLSLVADLGMGRPMERVLRQTVVAMRLGAAAGMDQAACSAAYYASLLRWVGWVGEPLRQACERWDGRGVPGLPGAEGLAPAIRLVRLADSIEAFHHAGGS